MANPGFATLIDVMHPGYLSAVGAVVASFGLYETILEDHLEVLRRNSEAAKIPVHRGFERRAKLLDEAGKHAFAHSPGIMSHLTSISKEALKLGKQRNILVHGFWVAKDPPNPMIAHRRKQQVFFYSPTLEELKALERDINALYHKQLGLFAWARHDDDSKNFVSWLTSDEKSQIREFYSRHPAPPPKPNTQRPRHLPFRD
jgi:hypothetical protein